MHSHLPLSLPLRLLAVSAAAAAGPSPAAGDAPEGVHPSVAAAVVRPASRRSTAPRSAPRPAGTQLVNFQLQPLQLLGNRDQLHSAASVTHTDPVYQVQNLQLPYHYANMVRLWPKQNPPKTFVWAYMTLYA
jgi:hypothetical protein